MIGVPDPYAAACCSVRCTSMQIYRGIQFWLIASQHMIANEMRTRVSISGQGHFHASVLAAIFVTVSGLHNPAPLRAELRHFVNAHLFYLSTP